MHLEKRRFVQKLPLFDEHDGEEDVGIYVVPPNVTTTSAVFGGWQVRSVNCNATPIMVPEEGIRTLCQ